MSRPLLWPVLFFTAGIGLAESLKLSFFCWYLFGWAVFVIYLCRYRNKVIPAILILALSFCLGAIILKNYRILPAYHIRKFVYFPTSRYPNVKGFIDSDPSQGENKSGFVLNAREIQFDNRKYKCCGRILVRLKGKSVFRYGQELILRGRLYLPFKAPGEERKSYRSYLSHQGIYALMSVPGDNFVQVCRQKNILTLKAAAFYIKNKVEKIIFGYLPGTAGGILDAMLLGEKARIPSPVYQAMMQIGTVHILVVSGFNVGIVASILILVFKLMRISRKLRTFLVLPLLLLYCLATGASNPVVRATVMASVFLLSYFFKRDADVLNSLSLSAIVILLINPNQLFDIGFQLSFSSVIALASVYPFLKARLKLVSLKTKIIKFLAEGVLASFSAWLGTFGLIAYYFGTFCPVTILANLVIVPLATLITLCGFSLISVNLVCPFLARFIANTIELAVVLLVKANFLFLKIPHAYFTLPCKN